ncbi:hypothetical protein ECANGB1_1601 [Enterospora canceri]|uniref:Zinc-ribbon 15 domain-containing protein n=1 Tax=Enterospora canceri TaxID=1081671 RepID=A0A1Y1S5R7_9MICR|nr:hypothetical protein ECANGB1_1601 [Enterospora canceri]
MSDCYCCLWPIEFGWEDFPVPIDTPEGYPDPPKNILFPACYKRCNTRYVRTTTFCSFCFIPCTCCDCGSEEPSVACEKCLSIYTNVSFINCKECNHAMTVSERYCTNCGSQNDRYGGYKKQVVDDQNLVLASEYKIRKRKEKEEKEKKEKNK